MTTSTTAELEHWVNDARRRSLWLLDDLSDEQLIGPRLKIVNPLLWEIGHVAWFQERWVLREALGRDPLWPKADQWFDSTPVSHDVRWDLPLPSRTAMVQYAADVHRHVLAALDQLDERLEYFVKLALFHEDMHTEAFTYTRQTLGYPPPRSWEEETSATAAESSCGSHRGDVYFAGGVFMLGSSSGANFVFDNEQWAHRVEIAPFAIARCAVTQAEFAEFVDGGGYEHRELWTDAGWSWRESEQATQPVYWRRDDGGAWQRRVFDHSRPLEPNLPMMHVNYHEAAAYCRWAGRRLPTEAEWEFAASVGSAEAKQPLSSEKRRYPWGDEPPTVDRANLDWREGGTIAVDSLAAGDSADGCRQMIGNVWEWTATPFAPYPGFSPGPYRAYSQPWFGTHQVLRGGCWATRSRLIRNAYRNYYTPDRRDIWAGFRTCAVDL